LSILGEPRFDIATPLEYASQLHIAKKWVPLVHVFIGSA
jgi:hypothetical protein